MRQFTIENTRLFASSDPVIEVWLDFRVVDYGSFVKSPIVNTAPLRFFLRGISRARILDWSLDEGVDGPLRFALQTVVTLGDYLRRTNNLNGVVKRGLGVRGQWGESIGEFVGDPLPL